MTVATAEQVKVVRWRGGQHPTLDNITRHMQDEGLRPYVWANAPNFRYPVRSHGYDKTLYCVQGSVEVTLSKLKQRVLLNAGDRIDIPRGVHYSLIVGSGGVQCIEGSHI